MANFFRNEDDDLRIGRIVLVAVAAIFGILLFFGSFRVISAEKVGVPVTLGNIGDESQYGFSLKWPFIEKFIQFDKTTQRFQDSTETYTQDIQPAHVKYVFTYRIVDANAPKLYRLAGKGYKQKLVTPKLNAKMKDVIGRWTAQEAVGNRDRVASEIEQALRKALDSTLFTDITFQIDDIVYSDAFEKGIEEKVLAEQSAQKAKNKTVQIEEEARQRVIAAEGEAKAKAAAAEGEAKAIAITGRAMRENPQYIELKKLEVQEAMARSAANWQNPVLSAGQASYMLNLPNGSGK